MNELIEQFIVESRELVEEATNALGTLSEQPNDADTLDGVFRSFHTLKGGAGIVDFAAMERTVHVAENGLSRVRSGEAVVTDELISNCLACLDQVTRWLDSMDRSGEVPSDADAEARLLTARLSEVSGASHAKEDRELRTHQSDIVREDHATQAELSADAKELLHAQFDLLTDFPYSPGRIGSAAQVASNVMRYLGREVNAEQIDIAREFSIRENDAKRLKEEIKATLELDASADAARADQVAPTAVLPRTLRVNAERIDALVRLTGELTVVKNAIGHVLVLAQTHDSSIVASLKSHHATLERVTTDMQRSVLGIRVLPLRTVMQRFPRLVREMASSLDKPAELAIEGGDTEADKAIVEMLFEPLLHVVRNSMDHGIESSDVRAQRGKPATAVIEMKASRQGDNVIVEVTDDGAGIDIDRIREIALKQGLIKADMVQAMNDSEILDLVFAPGFSTAGRVTELSGRGVGMDAIRSAIVRVGGKVSIESQLGRGTTVRFAVPFSVMMTHVMTVEVGAQMFGIPLDVVIETIRVPVDSIVCVGAAQAIVRRNRTIPLVELSHILGVENEKSMQGDAIVVVVSVFGQLAGIRVDRLGERMIIMLKPLHGLLNGMQGISGTTILGDGRVLLVLDVEELLQ